LNSYSTEELLHKSMSLNHTVPPQTKCCAPGSPKFTVPPKGSTLESWLCNWWAQPAFPI